MSHDLIPNELIESKIFVFRGKKVMVDRDLATLYGVATRTLNQAVRRNMRRFPYDFMFQLTKEEMENWVSQIVIPNSEKMGIRIPPLVFTEQGVAMISSILNSDRAIMVNIQIMRTFTKMREMLTESEELRRKIEFLEKQYDEKFGIIFEAIRRLIGDEQGEQKEIGFKY